MAAHQLAQRQADASGEAWRVYCLSPAAGGDGEAWSPEGYPVEPARRWRR